MGSGSFGFWGMDFAHFWGFGSGLFLNSWGPKIIYLFLLIFKKNVLQFFLYFQFFKIFLLLFFYLFIFLWFGVGSLLI